MRPTGEGENTPNVGRRKRNKTYLIDLNLLLRTVRLLLGDVHGIVCRVVFLGITLLVLVREVEACEEEENPAGEPAGGEDRPGDVVPELRACQHHKAKCNSCTDE